MKKGMSTSHTGARVREEAINKKLEGRELNANARKAMALAVCGVDLHFFRTLDHACQ